MSIQRPAKRVRLAPEAAESDSDVDHVVADLDDSSSSDEALEGEDSSEGEETGVTDEEEAIRGANEAAHAAKPKKRRRALSPEAFGSSLNALLDAPAPTAKQLSNLHRPARRAKTDEAIERKAHRLVLASRHAHEERGHVTDIISGWPARPALPFKEWPTLSPEDLETAGGGAEPEKVLRRLAQKGVVKLFNAIRAAQGVSTAPPAGSSAASSVGGKKRKAIAAKEETPDTIASTAANGTTAAAVSKTAPNLLGAKGKEQALANLSRASFLEILKTGKGTKSSVVPSIA